MTDSRASRTFIFQISFFNCTGTLLNTFQNIVNLKRTSVGLNTLTSAVDRERTIFKGRLIETKIYQAICHVNVW